MRDLLEIRSKLRGPVFAIITPFTEGGLEVDYRGLKKYVDFLYESGAKIFYIMGYNSRFSLLSNEEIMKLNKVVVQRVKDFNDPECVTIIADPLHCSTATTIKFAEHGHEIGADVISLIFREKVYFEDQLYDHHKIVSDNCDIGILIHEMPLNNGIPKQPPLINWPIEVLNRVADLEKVIAIKEDAKEDEYTKKVVNLLKDRLAIITSGNGMKQWLKVAPECHGWLSGIGGISPEIEVDFYQFYLKGNVDKCWEIINTIELPFDEIKDKFGWHLAIKSAMDVMKIMNREERMPLQKLSVENHDIVRQIMREIKNNYFTVSDDNP